MTLASSATGTARPLRADAQRNRRRILAAAAELFAQRGLDVGLDEIARHAGVGTGTVYRRFPDKVMLIEALFEDRMSAMIELAEQASEHPDPWAGLVVMLDGMAAMQMADRGLKELMFGKGCAPGSFHDRRMELYPLVEKLVARAQISGQLRADVDSSDLAVIQFMVHAAGVFAADVHPQLWRRHLGLILDGLRAHREAPTRLEAEPLALADFERLCGIRHWKPASGHHAAGL